MGFRQRGDDLLALLFSPINKVVKLNLEVMNEVKPVLIGHMLQQRVFATLDIDLHEVNLADTEIRQHAEKFANLTGNAALVFMIFSEKRGAVYTI